MAFYGIRKTEIEAYGISARDSRNQGVTSIIVEAGSRRIAYGMAASRLGSDWVVFECAPKSQANESQLLHYWGIAARLTPAEREREAWRNLMSDNMSSQY